MRYSVISKFTPATRRQAKTREQARNIKRNYKDPSKYVIWDNTLSCEVR